MHKDHFVGMGNNPNGPDLPLGFGMQMEGTPRALETYAGLTREEKESVIRYVQSGTTGEEALEKITSAVKKLEEEDKSFFINFSKN